MVGGRPVGELTLVVGGVILGLGHFELNGSRDDASEDRRKIKAETTTEDEFVVGQCFGSNRRKARTDAWVE